MGDKGNSECVRVVVRVRPLFGREIENGNQSIVEVDKRIKSVIVANPKGDGSEPPKQFTFDDVFDKGDTQFGIFEKTAKPIVHSVLEGYNGTIFAYGQTGTGKTHTMEGQLQPKEEQGIIPNAFDQIFEDITKLGNNTNFLVRASYLEIYNEDIRDLLAKNPNTRLEMKESPDSGVYVKDLTCFVVKSVPEIRKVGKKNRTVGATLMNQDSSRSHSIYTVTVETSTVGPDGQAMIRVGKLNLVDLAGSERQAKTGATGARLKEATKINLSLSALGNVISALVDGRHAHIPYRDSKLTRLLQDSLGGNTKTVMVANVGPADYNFDETISTLRYANRAKNIKNKPKINEDPKDAMLRQYEEEIQRLRAEMERRAKEGSGAAGGARRERAPRAERRVDSRLAEIREQMRRDAEEAMKEKTDKARQQAREAAEQAAKESMRALLEDGGQTAEERAQLEQQAAQQEKEMQEYLAMLERERKEQEELEQRLREMEAKVLHGEVNLLEVEQEQKAELERQAQELAEKKRLEEEAQRRINELEEENALENDQYRSVEEEIELKTRKLKRLFQTYKKVKVDVEDMRAEFQKDKEAMLDDIQALTQQIKLKNLVLDSFVPPSALEAMMALSTWNEHEQSYVVVRFDVAGNAIRRPPGTPGVGTTGDVERDLAEQSDQKEDPRQERLRAFMNTENERLQSVYYWYDQPGEGEEPGASGTPGGAGAGGGGKGEKKEKKRANPKLDIGRLQDAVPDLDEEPAVVYPKAQGLGYRR